MRSGRGRAPRRSSQSWTEAVGKVVRAIPRGRVLSYAEVALRAGKPGAARAVARALHRLDDVPWWRVLRSDGTLAPPVAREQAQLLAAERSSRQSVVARGPSRPRRNR